MPGKPRYKVSTVCAAIRKNHGLLFLAAQSLGCTVHTIYNYRNKYPKVRAAIEEEEGKINDVAESALYRGILNGESWAVCFRLKTKAKDRGYVERSELEVSTGKGLASLLNDDE